MNDATPLSPAEYDTVERFGLHNDDIDPAGRAAEDAFWTKFPDAIIATPTNIASVMTATFEPETPALAAAPEPTPVLACHLDCARQAILNGRMPTSKMTDYRVFRSGESLVGVLLHVEPLQVIAAGHALREDLVMSAAAAQVTIR